MGYQRVKYVSCVVFSIAGCFLSFNHAATPDTNSQAKSDRKTTPSSEAKTPDKSDRPYSRFGHNVEQHRLNCDSCHKFPSANWKQVRREGEPFPDVTDYPQHASCIGCHRQQFFKGAVPAICTGCHVAPSPTNSTRYPFPNPREIYDTSERGKSRVSEYRVFFPHEKHEGLFGRLDREPATYLGRSFIRAAFRQEKNKDKEKEKQQPQGSPNAACDKCHQTYQPQGESDQEFVVKPPKDLPETAFWLKKGAFKTAPQSHALCFTCHTPEEGLKPSASDCATCHKLMTAGQSAALTRMRGDFDPAMASAMGIADKTSLQKWSRREAVKFRHEWISHADLACSTCHTVASINTADPKGPTVTPSSCIGCHVTATSDEGGALNVEADQKKANAAFQCTKCHAILGKKAMPESHAKAIAEARAKK